MIDYKEEKIKRRDFRQCHDDDDYTPGAKPKKHGPKDFAVEVFVPKGLYFSAEAGWKKRGSYKKLTDAEKAAERIRDKDFLYKGLALRIVYKGGTILKEYPDIR